MTVIDILEVRADDASPIAVGRAVALKAEEALSRAQQINPSSISLLGNLANLKKQ